MSIIVPNGTIKFYSGVRLDPTYQNALSFASEEAREQFFHGSGAGTAGPLLIDTVTKESYQRVTSGSCEVELPVNRLYKCNYMAFCNADFSNKWFYAFVTNVEYVSNIVTRVFYEIDVLTTFYFDWSPLPSFVEREHTATDNIGDNIVTENIQYGELLAASHETHYYNDAEPTAANGKGLSVITCVAGTTEIDDRNYALVSRTGQMLNGIQMYESSPLSMDFVQSFQRFLAGLSASKDDIVSIFMYPKALIDEIHISVRDGITTVTPKSDTLTANRPLTLDGYTPQNKKLFTFPYCYLCVDNGTISNNYRWEWFNQAQPFQFRVRGAIAPGGEIYAAPIRYKGDGATVRFDERISFPPLPQVAYPIDSFQAWLAQTASSRKNKVINDIASGATSGATTGATVGSIAPGIGTAIGAIGGAIIGGVTGALGAKVSNDQAIAEASDMKNHAAGGGNGSLEVCDGKYGVDFKYMTLCNSDAKIIDDYFTMFGYAINAIKTPAIRTRPHWNYIKTCGLNMSAQKVPADYVSKIKAIHNNGVTYWKVHDEIGNYNLNNSV